MHKKEVMIKLLSVVQHVNVVKNLVWNYLSMQLDGP